MTSDKTFDLNVLHTRLEHLERDNAQLKTQFHTAQRRLRVQTGLALCGFVAAVFLSPANRAVMAQGYGVTLASLNTRLTALEHTVANIQLTPGPKGDKGDTGPQGSAGTFDGAARVTVLETKTQYLSVDNDSKSVIFSGCNLIVNNGLGATNGNPANPSSPGRNSARVNGLGNLIIGYNATGRATVSNDPNDSDIRTGSHNLILGDFNNYSLYGGIVAGRFNTISSPLASVTGGSFNIASGDSSSVTGGGGNIASGDSSSVTGGVGNIASGRVSSVSGGNTNTASGDRGASISCGSLNTATGEFASVSGGRNNTASGFNASVSGGEFNKATGFLSSVSGGNGVIQGNTDGWAGGIFHNP